MSDNYDSLKSMLMSRINDVFTSRPTWSRMPMLESEMLLSIQQVVDDEIERFKTNNERNTNEANNLTSAK